MKESVIHEKLEIEIDESILLEYLKKQSPPVIESSLLRHFFPTMRSRSFRVLDLSVVQTHFILYHYLHKLSRILEGSEYLIYINYIYIYLLKKPQEQFCPHFDDKAIRFCLAKKEIDSSYCSHHVEAEERLNDLQFLRPIGIKEYYLDFDNFNNLEAEYPEIMEQASRFKHYVINNEDIIRSYELLGLARGTSLKAVQHRYKELAKKYHPDLNASPEAQDKFQTITQGYNLIKEYLR